MDIIWESTVDEKFHCSVTRIDEYSGRLVVKDTNNQLFLDQEVGLSYSAIFGPDISDVLDWQNLCLEAIDHPIVDKE